ncbi:hypothetical protein [Pararhizobium sp.]|uniref:hypothetical protein n=1 Tax=Pararhizobium sp. TaxID=1977563 RepID=UPI002715EC78|nr:hypothetical protein [Pararhizobium sp.]MDO9417966.1 hypothetical protein [Pararhizobium sp.]
MKPRFVLLLFALIASGQPPSAFSMGRVPDIEEISGLRRLREAAQSAGDSVLVQATENLERVTKDLTNELRTAIDNAVTAQDKAIVDTATNLAKSANDIVDAGQAVARFAEREIEGYDDILTGAEKRVRDGKIADALWHLNTDSWQATNKNAAQLASENEIVAVAAQAAATAWGGPGGAAAYAAWFTYNQSGNVDLALKAGVYAYAMSSGNLTPAKFPSNTLDGVAKQAAMTGAVGGLAVAASGGNTQDSLDAFVKSGGAVLVQAGQSYVKRNYGSIGASKLDVYCTAIVRNKCAEAKKWYGKTKKQLDSLAALKDARPSLLITQNGDWAVSWHKGAVDETSMVTPSVALTYIGDGSPFKNTITEIAALSDPDKFSKFWALFLDIEQQISPFVFIGAHDSDSPSVGDQLRAAKDITIQTSPEKAVRSRGILPLGAEVIVLETKVIEIVGAPQQWVRIQPTVAGMLRVEEKPDSLSDLIAKIATSKDQQNKAQLKAAARRLVAKEFSFPPIKFEETTKFYRKKETMSYVSYEPETNFLKLRRQNSTETRPTATSSWQPSTSLDAIVTVKIDRLDKLKVFDGGAFDVDCNNGGPECVSYDVRFEVCGSVACDSSLNSWLLFQPGGERNATQKLKNAFITVIYKIDGRPAK